MEANRKRGRWTYAEYARLPREGSTRYEVIDGELVVTPAPSRAHQRLVATLTMLLEAFARKHDLGEAYPAPFDLLLGEGDYVEPDLLFVRKDRLDILSDRGCEAAPDLVIEITSPDTAARDRGAKLDRYRFFGVPEYWVVDPDERTVEVWDLAAGDPEPRTFRGSDTVRWSPAKDAPTLEVPLPELFESAARS